MDTEYAPRSANGTSPAIDATIRIDDLRAKEQRITTKTEDEKAETHPLVRCGDASLINMNVLLTFTSKICVN